MKAYSDLLVRTCHRRGAFAIGGMAAFIPCRRDPEVNERAFAKVREDKTREATAGFDGSWVAHPDLVPLCAEIFGETLGDRPNQLDVLRDDVDVTADDLLAVDRTPGERTEQGLRGNVRIGIQYLQAWLSGNGAAGDRQPDGGRRHRRDLALAGVAVDLQRGDARHRRGRHARARRADRRGGVRRAPRGERARRSTPATGTRPAGCSTSRPSARSSPTSSPCRRTSPSSRQNADPAESEGAPHGQSPSPTRSGRRRPRRRRRRRRWRARTPWPRPRPARPRAAGRCRAGRPAAGAARSRRTPCRRRRSPTGRRARARGARAGGEVQQVGEVSGRPQRPAGAA